LASWHYLNYLHLIQFLTIWYTYTVYAYFYDRCIRKSGKTDKKLIERGKSRGAYLSDVSVVRQHNSLTTQSDKYRKKIFV